MPGWFWDIHSDINGFGFQDISGTKMWVVLSGRKLFIYDNPYDNILKKTIDATDIMDMVESTYDKLEIKVEGVIIKMLKSDAFGIKVPCELMWAWGDDGSKVKVLWRRALISHHHAPANK